VVLAGLGVAGALALRARRARTEEAPPLAVLAPLAPELRAAVERWRKSAADLTGSASDQAEAGRRLLAEDTRQGALRAEERFQNALVLDPRRDDALAGYLQALALGRGAAVPEPVFREALALSEAGLQRSGRAPALLVATAQLLLSRGRSGEGLEQARALATEALQAGPPPLQAEAHLVLARVLLTSSRALARGHLEQAEALAPGLGRAVPLKAELLQAEGRYREAVDLLRERVRRDPEHWAALGELAGLLEGVGEVQAAREVYAAGAAARRPEAARALGVLLLRGEGARPREAVRVLRELLARRETLGAGEAPGVLVDLATAERAAGNAAGAQRAAEEALALAPALPGAHLQLLLLELSRGRAGAARPHLAAVEGKLQDAGLEALLAGRVALLGGDAAAAVQHFLRAVEADPRRTDAQLWAGVAAARAGRPADAFRLLRAALQQDPARAPASGVRPVPQVGGGVVAGELLAGADGHLLRLAEGEDVVPARLYEGLVRYHQRAGGAAERLLEQVVRQDVRNAPAFALRALLAAERGDRRAALRLGAVAAGEGRELALARAANAEALAEAGRTEDARQEMAAAHAAAPAVATYAVRLAELEAATGAKDAARERLLKVVARDPANAAAPRALYQLDR
jgi:tetratricopeptide (TPR) repeat protein